MCRGLKSHGTWHDSYPERCFRHPEEVSRVEVGVLGPDQDQVFPSGQQVQVRGPAQGQRGGEVEEGVEASAGFEPMILKSFLKVAQVGRQT